MRNEGFQSGSSGGGMEWLLSSTEFDYQHPNAQTDRPAGRPAGRATTHGFD